MLLFQDKTQRDKKETGGICFNNCIKAVKKNQNSNCVYIIVRPIKLLAIQPTAILFNLTHNLTHAIGSAVNRSSRNTPFVPQFLGAEKTGEAM